jgi:hypothetical protein
LTADVAPDDARALFDELRADPAAQRRFRAGYPGTGDPLDALESSEPDAAIDEAVRQYRHPDEPPQPPPYRWWQHPLAGLVAGALATVAVAVGWMLWPRQAEPYRPIASSLDIFDREQNAAEADDAIVFSDVLGDSVRVLSSDGFVTVYAGIADRPRLEVGPYQEGDICLFASIREGGAASASGTCVPPEVFDSVGIWAVGPNSVGGPWYHWGPVGDELRVFER